MLAANHGTLFGLKFARRRRSLSATRRVPPRWFPFLDFPPDPGRVFGHVILDKFDLSSSITASSRCGWLTAVAVVAVAQHATAAGDIPAVSPAAAVGAVA